MVLVKTIRDPIHGDIEVNDLELRALDSPQMQRLRRVKQLSFCSLIYPGANHTRFEHSLGTMHIAGRMANAAGIDDDSRQKIRIAALVHDVGHLPYSHSLEFVLEADHEQLGRTLLKSSELADIIFTNFSRAEIMGLLEGKGPGKIISSQIDADRIDYLARDSHYTGVAYGVVDIERIIRVTWLEGSTLCFNEKGLTALESLLVGRNLMFSAVYFHHTVRIAEAMLQEAARDIKEKLTVQELVRMGDDDLRNILKTEAACSDIFECLDKRKLYKLAHHWDSFMDKKKLISAFSDGGLDNLHYIINDVHLPHNLSSDLNVISFDSIVPISNVSDIVNSLDSGLRRLEGTEVYIPEANKEKIVSVCERIS